MSVQLETDESPPDVVFGTGAAGVVGAGVVVPSVWSIPPVDVDESGGGANPTSAAIAGADVGGAFNTDDTI